MKIIRLFIGIVGVMLLVDISCFGAYLTNIPIQITQPNGDTLTIYASGDEYYNWLHDINGYTVVQDDMGYYVYAQYNEKGNDIKASAYIVGKCNPQEVGLQPNIACRREIINNIIENAEFNSSDIKGNGYIYPTTGTINNIVIYIRFADQTEFTDSQSKYTNMFNNSATGANSVYNYFKETSNNKLTVNSSFYPTNNGSSILSYQDIYTRNYYCKYSSSNPIGYTDDNKNERLDSLLLRAINFVKNQIDTTIDYDTNNDTYVDNISFIIRGGNNGWNTILWPQVRFLFATLKISNYNIRDITLYVEQNINQKGVGLLCHEIGHVLGAPDLYHHYDQNHHPVGYWDIMAIETNPPQYMNTGIRCYIYHWIDSIPEITTSGTYTLNPVTSSINNCYKISIKNTSDFLLLEYRKRNGTFETQIPNEGLLIYRIHLTSGGNFQGNIYGTGYGGVSTGIYVYRKDGTINEAGDSVNAVFSSNSGRTRFSSNSNPRAFMYDSTIANVLIKDVSSVGETISFYVKFCDGKDITYSNTNNLPNCTNASNTISTNGNVIVKNTDNVLFEARNSVLLNKNFTVNLGGQFEINMDGCFE